MANLGNFLDKSIIPNALHILGEAGALAAGSNRARATHAYLVGGPVRDLLLGVPALDVDIAVDADGPAFAEELARRIRGEVVQRSEFATARVISAGVDVDVTMIRSETYAEPGALPSIKPGTLADDLARRDFTINSMAVDLTPAGWGELFDPHNGRRDIVLKSIRALHDGSFDDDPTRMLRAIRYSVRLGFDIDPGTLIRLERSAANLANVSAARRIAELMRMLHESKAAEMLVGSERYGLLAGIHPGLRISQQTAEHLDRLPDGLSADESDEYRLALIGAALTEGEAESLVRDLRLQSEWNDALLAGPRFKGVAALLDQPELKPSEVVSLLRPFPLSALRAHYALAPPMPRKERLAAYLSKYRHSKPELTGDDLLDLGVPQGPLVGRLIEELAVGRLDKTILSRFEEEAHVRRRLPMLT